MLNGNGALDTATHRLLERMRAELDAARTGREATEPPTEEVRVEAPRRDEPHAAGSS